MDAPHPCRHHSRHQSTGRNSLWPRYFFPTPELLGWHLRSPPGAGGSGSGFLTGRDRWRSLSILFLLWYASSMTLAKRKISVSLDEDLVEELEREDQGLSTQVNVAVRAELERRRRHRLLVEFLDQLDAERGPVDESLVEKYIGLLG